MSILITTPRGKVGVEVVKALRERAVPVRLGAHSVEATQAAFPDADIVPLDYGDEASLVAALKGVTAIYLASPGDSAAEPEQRFIDLAKQAGVRKVVKLSALGVENAESPLRSVEKHIEASELAWTILRPTFFDQNYATSHAAAIKAGSFAEPAEGAKAAFIDTRDVAAVAVEALTKSGHEGKAYTLTGPELLSREQVAAAFSRELDRPVKYVSVTDEQFRASAKGALTQSYVELLSYLYERVRAGAFDVKTDEVERILRKPPIPFNKFIRDHRNVWL